MGIFNRWTMGASELAALSERTAATQVQSLGAVLTALSYFDEAGEKVHRSDFSAAIQSYDQILPALQSVAQKIDEVARNFRQLQVGIANEAARLNEIRDFGFDLVGDDTKALIAKDILDLQQVLRWVNLLIEIYPLGKQALSDRAKDRYFALIADPARAAAKSVVEALQHILYGSTITHLAADSLKKLS